MKKLLAFLLAMTLVFTSVAFAFADEEISGDAQTCITLGMLKGDGNGVTAEYLASTPNRLQTAVMFLRLKGLEETALAYTSDKNFADAAQVAWEGGRNIMAYLYNNPDLGWVGDGGNFNPTGIMTAQAYYKVMLETLGYKQNTATVMGDFLWANVVEFAAEHGLKAVANVETFTVNDLATATVEALQATVKDAETTLVESLVADGIVEEDTAIEVGLVQSPLQKAIAAAQEAIAAIPAVDALTLDDEATVTAAADAIDAVLALDAEAVVEGADVVDAALAKITELQTAAADLETAITAAVEAIKAIPATVTLADKATVDAAKAAVDAALALNAEAVIEGADLVQPALDAVAAIEAAKTAADTALAAVPATVTLADKAKVTAARTAVDAALALDATLVIDTTALVAAEATIAEIELPLAVESVTALNLVEVEVIFNKAVDKTEAEDEANYDISGLTVDSAVLQADGKSVILTLDTAADEEFTQQGDYTLDITSDLVEGSFDFSAFDATIPVAQSIELTGPDTIEITFSEPLDEDDAGIVEINGGIYGVTADADNTNVIEATLSASSLKDGEYTVEVSGYKDFAGYAVPLKKFTLTYAKDTTLPTVTLVSADQTEVVVEFDKAVTTSESAVLSTAYFYHSYSSYTPADVTTTDNKKFTLDFSNRPLPEGTVKIGVNFDANDEPITDAWGNEMKADVLFTAAIVVDNTKPQATKIETDGQDKLVLTFDEGLDVNTAQDEDNYTVKDSDGDEVTNFTATYDADDKTVTLDFVPNLQGAYTVALADITDDAVEANEIAAVTLSITVADETAPDLTAVTVKGVEGTGSDPDYVIVTYPEDMDSSVLNKENYLLSGDDGTTWEGLEADDSVAFFGGNDTVKITIDDNSRFDVEDDTEGAGNDNDFRVAVARAADASGNKSVLLSAVIIGTDDGAPTVDTIIAKDTKTVEVTFNGVLTTVVASGFVAHKAAASDQAAAVSYVVKDGDTIVTVTLKSAEQFDDAAATGVTLDIVASKLKSDTGKYVAADLGNVITDGIAPSIADIDQTAADTVTITFDEVIDITNEALAATDFVITDADANVLVAGVDYDVVDNAADDVLELDFSIGDYSGYEDALTIDTKASVTYIYDANGTNAKVNAYGDPEEIVMDATAATITAMTEDATANIITVTFSEAMDEAAVENAANWTFTDASGGGIDVDTIVYNTTTHKATVTLTGAAANTDSLLAEAGIVDAAGISVDAAKDLGTRDNGAAGAGVYTIN